MSSTFDNIVAFKVLYMLITPFEKTEAYRLGVIDKDGKVLIKAKDQTPDQKEAYDYLDRMVFNLKRLIGKVPGGKSIIASMAAALYLVKEDTKMSATELENRFNSVLSKILEQDITLAEETIIVEKFLKSLEEDGVGGGAPAVPANATGPSTSTDIPVIKPKKKTTVARRKLPVKV